MQTFASSQEFLDSKRPDAPGCIILDVRLPGRSGLEFQKVLQDLSIQLPVIFISAHGDVPISVRAMKSGAIEFLTKPLREQELLDAVHAGIEQDRARRQEAELLAELRGRYESLTAREREMMHLVVSGSVNKQIAAQAGLSEITVKVHRGHVMEDAGEICPPIWSNGGQPGCDDKASSHEIISLRIYQSIIARVLTNSRGKRSWRFC